MDKHVFFNENKNRYIALIVGTIVLAILPSLRVPFLLTYALFLYFVYLTMSQMWNLLAGYAGLLFFGIAAFSGLSGYSIAILNLLGVNLYICILCGAAISAIIGTILTLPLLRRRGLYFAVGTMLLALILRTWFNMWIPLRLEDKIMGAGAGYPIRDLIPFEILYLLALFVCLFSNLLLYAISKSKLGLGLMALRDNEDAAWSLGIHVTKLKIYAIFIASFLIGLSSGFLHVYVGQVSRSVFDIGATFPIICGSLIGGIGTIEGPILGSILTTIINLYFNRFLSFINIAQGVVLILILLIAPKGLFSIYAKARSRFLTRRISTTL